MTSPPSSPPPSSDGGRRYELEAQIGQGGFGSVWRGRLVGSAGYSKIVAIKLLSEEVSHLPELGQRFRDEARMLALLRHRAVVHMEDLVQIDGRWAVVMEYVEGADLRELIAQGPLPPRPALEIAVEVAAALRVAHEAREPRTGEHLDIVHRDIKPANIRLSPSGEVKVLDFGIARAQFSGREARTRSLFFGTPGYLAPERMEMRDSAAVDVYALGVVLAEALLGRQLGQLPVDEARHGARVQAVAAECAARVPGEVGGPLGGLLRSTLAYLPEDRPRAAAVEHTAQELVEHAGGPWLRRWASAAVGAKPTEPTPPPRALTPPFQPAVTADPTPEPRPLPARAPAPEGTQGPTRWERLTPGSPGPSVDAASPSGVAGASTTSGWAGRLMLGYLAIGVLSAFAISVFLLFSSSLQDLFEFVGETTEVSADAPPGGVDPSSPRGASLSSSPDSHGDGMAVTPAEPLRPPEDGSTVQTPGPVSPVPAAPLSPEPHRQTDSPSAHSRAPKVSKGRVSVTGDGVDSAVLTNAAARAYSQGLVPEGSYTLLVTFSDGHAITLPSPIVVSAGAEVVVRCDQRAQNCRSPQ